MYTVYSTFGFSQGLKTAFLSPTCMINKIFSLFQNIKLDDFEEFEDDYKPYGDKKRGLSKEVKTVTAK